MKRRYSRDEFAKIDFIIQANLVELRGVYRDYLTDAEVYPNFRAAIVILDRLSEAFELLRLGIDKHNREWLAEEYNAALHYRKTSSDPTTEELEKWTKENAIFKP